MNKIDSLYYEPNRTRQQVNTNSVVGIDFHDLLQMKIELAQKLNRELNRGDHFFSSSTLPMFSPNLSLWMNSFNSGYSSFAPINEAFQAYRTTSPARKETANIKAPTDQFNHFIRQAAEKYNVDEKLIHAIIKMESNYNPNVTSRAGAAGLM